MPITRTVPDYPHGWTSKTVLVIDDELALREMIATVLMEENYTVITAGTAEEGIKFVQNIHIDCAILDIFMRGEGGLWALQQLQQSHKNTKLIAMSGGWKGMGPSEVTEAADRIGADATFEKPFDIDEIVKTVDELVGPALTLVEQKRPS